MNKSLSRRENFFKAVYRQSPDYVPIAAGYCRGFTDEASDCKIITYRIYDHDWGYSFSRAKGDTKTMGLVNKHLLGNISQIQNWRPPNHAGEDRFPR